MLISFAGICQNIVNRASSANTVQDMRLQVGYNLYVPRYNDTTAANLVTLPPSSPIGIDSCGAIIFTYDINNFWARACSPKRWVRVSGQQILPDGVYSGGNVAYSGVGLDFIVSPAVFVLNGVIFNSPQKTVTLDPADPAQDRIDDIILSPLPTGADKITGQPGTNQQPSVNPQTQLFRAFVRVPAGSLVPAGVTQLLVYDQDLGLPDEWTPSVNGGATVDFDATDFPYHLTKYAKVTGFTTAESIDFTYSDTVHTYNKGTFVEFVRLFGIMPQAVNLNVELTLGGTVVSQLVNFTSGGMQRNLINQYQGVFIPFPSFGAGDIVFDGFRIIATGAGTIPTFGLDYIQMQSGLFSPPSQILFGVGDNFATAPRFFNQNGNPFNYANGKLGFNQATLPTHTISIGDETSGAETFFLYASDGTSSDILTLGTLLRLTSQSAIQIRPRPALGFMQYSVNPITGEIIEDFYSSGNLPIGSNGVGVLEAGVSYEYFIKPVGRAGTQTYLTLYDSIKFRGIRDESSPDSLITTKNGVVTRTAVSGLIVGSSNSNIGAGYRWAIPFTNNIKTSFVTNGIFADSTTNTNGITFQVDSLSYTTRPRTQKMIDSSIAIINALGKATNLGAGFRLVVPFTNQIKTLFNSYALNWDSTTNANGLTPKIDTTLMATRAFAQSLTIGGVTGVSSVSVVTGNGFSGTVATATSTPAITLSTTITGLIKGNGTAISAAVAGTDYLTPTGSAAGLTAFPTLNQNTTGTAATISGIGTVAHGGTGLATLTPYAVMAAGTTATGNMQQVSGLGTAGQALVSNGAGALPTWQTISVSAGVSSITGTANQVIASASTGAVTLSLPQAIALTSAVTFGRLTVGGIASNAPITFVANALPTAAAGRFGYDGTNILFSPAATFKRFALTNNVTPGNGQIPIGNGTDFTTAAITPSNNGTLVTNSAGGIAIGPNDAFQTLADGATITFNAANGLNAKVTLGGSGRAVVRSNWVSGKTYNLEIIQDGTGGRTITTWPAGIRWQNGVAPTLPTAANSIFMVTLLFDGTNVLGNYPAGAYQ